MYKENFENVARAKSYEGEDLQPQSELMIIIERLRHAINHLDNILGETTIKLNTISRHIEPQLVSDPIKDKQPETVVEEINMLLSRFVDLNDRATSNLNHLNSII
jgi:hypothetical protein